MSTQLIIVLILSAAIIGAAIWLRSRRRKPAQSNLPTSLPDNVPYGFTTPGGVLISSVSSVITSQALEAIDEGITNQLVRITAAHPDWNNKKSLPDYKIMFIEPQTRNQINDPGSPAIFVHGIQSAGTCIGVGNDGFATDFIVLPHQSPDWGFTDYLMHSAWNESEHIREWFNDPVVFNSFLGSGDIHPHFP